MSEKSVGESIAFAFKDLSVQYHGKHLVEKVTGYVRKNCITAILGPSAAGKSVLLQAVAGHIQDLDIGGKVYMDGREVNPKLLDNPVAYVPQYDSLIGELTAREMTRNTALLKRNDPLEKIEKDVDELLKKLGLGHVADGIIGTLIFRGLSGGQKKRVQVATELIASPSILLLDEPTSGLDSSAAYEALSCVRDLVKDGKHNLSVMLTIHQPNSKLLSLFDDIMVMESGQTTFFGPLPRAIDHFAQCGFTCPAGVTPTDFFLQISDSNFVSTVAKGADNREGPDAHYDFKKAFRDSSDGMAAVDSVDKYASLCVASVGAGNPTSQRSPNDPVPLWRQIYILVYREYALAYRDPTLYYFQLGMLMSFCLLVGGVFWDLPHTVGTNFNIIPSGLLWIVLLNVWVHAFKVYYLSAQNRRVALEIANGTYGPLAVVLADLVATATLTCMFIPVGTISYHMMGFPAEAYPFVILGGWMTCMAAEAMVAALAKLSKNATTCMVFVMISLVTLETFGGGVFLPWKDCPDYWLWLQEITVFAQGSRTVIMEVLDHMTFECDNPSNGICTDPGTGDQYQCTDLSANGATCEVEGREILFVTQGVGVNDSYWTYFGYLVLLFVCLKSIVVLFTYIPVDRVWFKLHLLVFGPPVMEAPSTPAGSPSKPADIRTQSIDGVIVPAEAVIPCSPFRQKSVDDMEEVSALSWSDFSVILPKTGAKLVDNVSGFVRSGSILALMGPSGAGKTTLLNGLARRADYARIEGDVKFAGHIMTAQDLTYIPQFDEVNDVMSPQEHIELVGRLTCVDHKQMLERLEEILDVLGLTAKRNVPVRSLSGGEIKRLSIGVGLISNPNVLFLDEPTTGLDSTAAYSIVNYLVKMARRTNVAVIMTIHQPSALVFDLLDDLFLLERGRVVYGGSIPAAAEHFASLGHTNPDKINPADYYLDLVQLPPRPEEPDVTWRDMFNGTDAGANYVKELSRLATAQNTGKAPGETPIPSVLARYGRMTLHFFHYFTAEPGYFVHRVWALLIIAFVLGTLYLDLNTNTSEINAYVGGLFATSLGVMLCAVASTALFARDRREAVDRIKNGFYHPGVYVAAQTTVSLLYNLGAVTLFTCVFHWLSDLNPSAEAFIYDILISWAHISVEESMLMIFIETLKDDFLSTTGGMLFIGTNMLFAGFFRPQDEIPMAINWFCYVVPFRVSIVIFALRNSFVHF